MADHTPPLESGQLLSPELPILASPPPPTMVNGEGPQQEVCKYHDSCRVRSRNHSRGLGPDRASQDCGDSEEDSQRWLTPLCLTFSWRSCKDTSFFVLGFFILVLAWY